MRILHVSDVHFGKPHLPEVLDAVVRFVHDSGPDAVVLSGDLTQRAKVREFRGARAFLDGLAPHPLVVTAGNHDVPLYRFWERLLAPYRNYRTHIAPQLDTVVDIDGRTGAGPARFVALNSASPYTAIVNGRLTTRQLDFAAKSFASAAPGSLRVLVVHHNLVVPAGEVSPRPLPGAAKILERLRNSGTDLILSGHIHQSCFGWSGDDSAGREVDGLPVILAGTASSNRGRGMEAGRNSVNLIRVQQSGIEVTAYLYSQDTGRFVPGKGHRYSNAPAARPGGRVDKGIPRGEAGGRP